MFDAPTGAQVEWAAVSTKLVQILDATEGLYGPQKLTKAEISLRADSFSAKRCDVPKGNRPSTGKVLGRSGNEKGAKTASLAPVP